MKMDCFFFVFYIKNLRVEDKSDSSEKYDAGSVDEKLDDAPRTRTERDVENKGGKDSVDKGSDDSSDSSDNGYFECDDDRKSKEETYVKDLDDDIRALLDLVDKECE